jgi:hypothetical protein
MEKEEIDLHIKELKKRIREAIKLAIQDGRIRGKPSDYSISVKKGWVSSKGWVVLGSKIATSAYPKIDYSKGPTALYEYPYSDELRALEKLTGVDFVRPNGL